MKKLFVSFTALLREVGSGRITQTDLDNGLFYFGCTKEHAVNPSAHKVNEVEWFFECDMDRGKEVHEQIKRAVLEAEKEGRATFHQLHERNSYDQLNELLIANGFDPLDVVPGSASYSYPGAEDLVKEAGLLLEVVR